MQNDETNRQIARTNHRVKILAVKQAILTNTVIRLVASQNDLNAPIEKKFAEMTEAQHRTEQEISDLTKAIENFITFSFGNENSPPE